MLRDQNSLHIGSLFNLLRHASIISREAAQEIEIYLSSSRLYPQRKKPSHPVQVASNEIESAATVVPVTVMFTDLRGFTTLVEEYPPNQVVQQLNEYFSCMTRIIVEHDGVLDKYMGDEIMAYFECQSPLEYSKAAHNAITAAIEMLQALEELNHRWSQRGWPTLTCGIGINSGPVLKGNIGSMIKLETTIIGDTVNVASRLQQLNKDYNARLLISGSTYKLVQGEVPVRSLGDISIRGKRKMVTVYEVELPVLCVSDPLDFIEPQSKIS